MSGDANRPFYWTPAARRVRRSRAGLPAQVERGRRRRIGRLLREGHRPGRVTMGPETPEASRLGLVGFDRERIVMAAGGMRDVVSAAAERAAGGSSAGTRSRVRTGGRRARRRRAVPGSSGRPCPLRRKPPLATRAARRRSSDSASSRFFADSASSFHSGPSMSSMETNVGSSTCVKRRSCSARSRSTRRPTSPIAVHSTSLWSLVARGSSHTRDTCISNPNAT